MRFESQFWNLKQLFDISVQTNLTFWNLKHGSENPKDQNFNQTVFCIQ